jgi:transposase
MLDALAAGQRDPRALAQLARGSMRGKIGRLEQALDCSFFTDQHAAVLAMMLAATGYYSAQIEALTATIEALVAPYLRQVEQIDAVPGIGTICAQDIIGEIGTDMTVFPTAPHLVSWARWSPQVKQSAGKRKGSNSTGRGNPYLGAALGEAVIGAARTPSFLGARYRRLARRMPKKKALAATGNSMLTIIHALLADPDASYHDLGPGYYEQRLHTRRQARNHIRSLERLGYKVTVQAIDPGTGELLAPAS